MIVVSLTRKAFELAPDASIMEVAILSAFLTDDQTQKTINLVIKLLEEMEDENDVISVSYEAGTLTLTRDSAGRPPHTFLTTPPTLQ